MHDEFAEEVVSMVEYTRNQAHMDFEYFSPFNETDCYPPEGPRIHPDEAPKVLEAVARRLRKEGLGDIRLAAAGNAIITNDYTDPILKDEELMKQLGVFTYQAVTEGIRFPERPRQDFREPVENSFPLARQPAQADAFALRRVSCDAWAFKCLNRWMGRGVGQND
jgi:hypothetical protein